MTWMYSCCQSEYLTRCNLKLGRELGQGEWGYLYYSPRDYWCCWQVTMLTYLTVTLGIIGVAKFLQEGIPQQVSLVSPLAQRLLFYMDIIFSSWWILGARNHAMKEHELMMSLSRKPKLLVRGFVCSIFMHCPTFTVWGENNVMYACLVAVFRWTSSGGGCMLW